MSVAEETTVARRSSISRRSDVQGLRAIAVVLVVAYHAELPVTGGFVGVDVFFVISGYVITRMLTAEMAASGRIEFGTFYSRRIRRLLPALAAMLTVVLLAAIVAAPLGARSMTAATGASAAVFNANTYLARAGQAGYFDVGTQANALLHTWSLSVEEQFYFVFPALILAAWLMGLRRRRWGSVRTAGVAMVLILVGSFALSWALTVGREVVPRSVLSNAGLAFVDTPEFAFYSSVTRAWEFAAGGLFALVARSTFVVSTTTRSALALLGAGGIGYAALWYDESTLFPGVAAVVPVVATLCLLAAGEGVTVGHSVRFLSVRPLVWIGDLSYSWYLWHWPCIVFALAFWPGRTWVAVVAGIGSLLPALVSFHYIESPLRRVRQPSGRATAGVAVVCIVIPLTAAAMLALANRSASVTSLAEQLSPPVSVSAGCHERRPLGDPDRPPCTWRAEEAIGSAVLLGDSNAGHFSEGFIAGANEVGLDATVATFSECPFVDVELTLRGGYYDECRTFVADSLEYLLVERPDIVVLASASDMYIEEQWSVLRDPQTGVEARTPDEKERVWRAGLDRIAGALTGEGIAVVIVHPVPRFETEWDPQAIATVRLLQDPEAVSPTRDLSASADYQRRALTAERSIASQDHLVTIDTGGVLCPTGVCRAYDGEKWIWRDSLHISHDASTELTPAFAAALQTVRS